MNYEGVTRSRELARQKRECCVELYTQRRATVIYSVQQSEEWSKLYIVDTKQPLYKCMARHRRVNSPGLDSAGHLHFKDKGHSFEGTNADILDREEGRLNKEVPGVS